MYHLEFFFGRDAGQFGINNTSDHFLILPFDSDMQDFRSGCTESDEDNDSDECSEFMQSDLQENCLRNCTQQSALTNSELEGLNSTTMSSSFLALCITRDELAKKGLESLEHNAVRNQVAYLKKVKNLKFHVGQDVLFANS